MLLERSIGREKLHQTPLEILSFKGVDSGTSQREAFGLHLNYPKIEFGIFATGEGGATNDNRRPALPLVYDWAEFSTATGLPMSIHLCGGLARGIMLGRCFGEVLDICQGFNRVQIDPGVDGYNYQRIAEFADKVVCSSVILQHEVTTESELPIRHPKIEYLFNYSRKEDVRGFLSQLQSKNGAQRLGYTGELNVKNVAQIVGSINRHQKSRAWLGLESGIRNEDDYFDLNKVREICEVVFERRNNVKTNPSLTFTDNQGV